MLQAHCTNSTEWFSHIQKRHQSFKVNCKRAESREIKFCVGVGAGSCIKTYLQIDKGKVFVLGQGVYNVQ